MRCVSLVSSSVWWQGQLSESFTPMCGLRQGDSISHYLFIFCPNELSLTFHEGEKNGKFHAIKLGQKEISLSHFFFVDDIMLFNRANQVDVSYLMQTIRHFLNTSNFYLNLQKSQVLISPNATRDLKHQLRYLLGMQLVGSLGKYLGLPLISDRISKHHFVPVIDKMRMR